MVPFVVLDIEFDLVLILAYRYYSASLLAVKIMLRIYLVFTVPSLWRGGGGDGGWSGGAMLLGYFQGRSILLICSRVGQGPTALAIGAGGVVWTFFSRILLFFLPLSGRRPDID